MAWHITPASNVLSVLREGLKPQIGERSEQVGEDREKVHLFSTFADLESAHWIEDAFDEDVPLALFHVGVPSAPGAWTECLEAVTPDRLILITRDLDAFQPDDVIRALDKVDSPFATIDEFRATKALMPADHFGAMVGDPQWQGDQTLFVVYAANYYISVRPSSDAAHRVYDLDICEEGWIGDGDAGLNELEERLFTFAHDQHYGAEVISTEPPAGLDL